jgi:hypothetical protein
MSVIRLAKSALIPCKSASFLLIFACHSSSLICQGLDLGGSAVSSSPGPLSSSLSSGAGGTDIEDTGGADTEGAGGVDMEGAGGVGTEGAGGADAEGAGGADAEGTGRVNEEAAEAVGLEEEGRVEVFFLFDIDFDFESAYIQRLPRRNLYPCQNPNPSPSRNRNHSRCPAVCRLYIGWRRGLECQ